MTVQLGSIIDAITTTLSAAPGLAVAESYDELSPGIPDTPALQVWPAAGNTGATGTNDRTSFRGGARVGLYTINADLYARQRSHIGQDMASLVGMIVEIETILSVQDAAPFFGLDAIKAFRWNWEHVTFENEGGNFKYVGARFSIQVWTF